MSELKSIYDIYSKPPQGSGRTSLCTQEEHFILNGKKIRIMGGSIHYWRVPRQYWRDRLQKIRAAGLNCIDVYVVWSLHEKERGKYDFGEHPKDEFSQMLDLKAFLQIAQEEDLLVFLRPGPYICAETDFGGMPSWLLREEGIKLRSSDPKYLTPAKDFLRALFGRLSGMSFVNGGPIIAIQVENEYGAWGENLQDPRDTNYMKELHRLSLEHFPSSEVLYFTSDNPSVFGELGAIPNVLQTANFQAKPKVEFDLLKKFQGKKPLYVAEFWCGWFDHWLEKWHNKWDFKTFKKTFDEVLEIGASFNFYMCHGGTNFAFTAGANASDSNQWPFYTPDVTSYDYDCLISENGAYTEKYQFVKERLLPLNKAMGILTPDPPAPLKMTYPVAYPQVAMTRMIPFNDILAQVPCISTEQPMPMEDLPINNGNGQSFGYVVYKTNILLLKDPGTVSLEKVRDLATLHLKGVSQVSPGVLVPEQLRGFGTWTGDKTSFKLPYENKFKHPIKSTLEILVENCGRLNYGKPSQLITKKGLSEGSVKYNGEIVKDWNIYPLEFNSDWIKSLKSWLPYSGEPLSGPALLEGDLQIEEEPQDTFLDATPFGKGVAFVNGMNLGRFWCAGPQQTLYLPGPFLKKGSNKLTLFVQYTSEESHIQFLDKPLLGTGCPTGITPGSTGELLSLDK